ncbi:Atxe2 family lasso peptide isopeptidase [Luteimonas sp. SDU101]|uniref:Atxe2 family lasso peptide isopeptidase n=1 Tax=Luteimonas sp. SDU101 TaxID=3422593 RepID=UPI003EB710B1
MQVFAREGRLGARMPRRTGAAARWLRVLVWAVLTHGGIVAHAQAIPPRQLLEVVDFGPPVVSPDGRLIAFRVEQASIERNSYDSVWYVQPMDGAHPPRRVADGGVPLRDAAGVASPVTASWSTDGRWLYYTALLDGRIDVWRAAADGSRAEPLTRDAADVRGYVLDAAGGRLFYRVGPTREAVVEAEQLEYDEGIRIDGNVPIGQGLFRSINIEGRWATQRYAGMWFGRAPLLADVPDRWKVVDLASLQIRDALAAERPPPAPGTSDLDAALTPPWALAEEPGGSRLAMLTRSDPPAGYRHGLHSTLTMLPDKTTRRSVACTANACVGKALGALQWRPQSDEVLFTVTDPLQGLAQSILRWNVRTGAVHPVVATRGTIGGGRGATPCGVSASAMACVIAEPDRPPRLERVDLESGQRAVLFDPNLALAATLSAVAPSELMRWESADGQTYTGQFLPARGTAETPPLFVTYYNCAGFLRGGVGDEWPLASLAEHGIAALCINDPPGYVFDAVQRYGRGIAGVTSAVAHLASEGRIDPTRVGMGGLSFGSEVALWAAIQTDLLRAVSVTSPAIEPNFHLFNTLRSDAFFEEMKNAWGLGSPSETPERWHELSPAYNVDRIRAPVLFQMPEQEYLYALGVSLPLVRQGRADLYVFPNETHQKFQPRHKLAAYERNLDWFRFWLQGHEDPKPGKAEGYQRWRTMRAAQCLAGDNALPRRCSDDARR